MLVYVGAPKFKNKYTRKRKSEELRQTKKKKKNMCPGLEQRDEKSDYQIGMLISEAEETGKEFPLNTSGGKIALL